MTRPGSRTFSGSRLVGALLSLLVGVLGMAALWQPLKLVTDSTECVGLSPLQSWAGLKLHVVAETVACRPGSFLQGDSYMPVMSLSLAVTVSALLVGVAILASVVGGIATVRSALHRLGSWVRKTLAPVVEVLAPQPQPQPIPVRVPARSRRRPHDPQSRRGPPSSAC
jgi:hypothetical protein